MATISLLPSEGGFIILDRSSTYFDCEFGHSRLSCPWPPQFRHLCSYIVGILPILKVVFWLINLNLIHEREFWISMRTRNAWNPLILLTSNAIIGFPKLIQCLEVSGIKDSRTSVVALSLGPIGTEVVNA